MKERQLYHEIIGFTWKAGTNPHIRVRVLLSVTALCPQAAAIAKEGKGRWESQVLILFWIFTAQYALLSFSPPLRERV